MVHEKRSCSFSPTRVLEAGSLAVLDEIFRGELIEIERGTKSRPRLSGAVHRFLRTRCTSACASSPATLVRLETVVGFADSVKWVVLC